MEIYGRIWRFMNIYKDVTQRVLFLRLLKFARRTLPPGLFAKERGYPQTFLHLGRSRLLKSPPRRAASGRAGRPLGPATLPGRLGSLSSTSCSGSLQIMVEGDRLSSLPWKVVAELVASPRHSGNLSSITYLAPLGMLPADSAATDVQDPLKCWSPRWLE